MKNEQRLAAIALFSDLLAKPEKQSAKLKSKTSSRPEATATPNPGRSAYFTAESREYLIVRQVCTTCGSFHEYAQTKLVRFRALRRKDNLYLEVPTVLPEGETIPSRITRIEEQTDFCPTCVDLASILDNSTLFELSSKTMSLQQELFK